METIAPDRSEQQRLDALRIANDIRTRRAREKKDIKAGRLDMLDILSDPPEHWQSAKAFDLLMAQERYGRHKSARALTMCGCSHSKTIAGLTDGQRQRLREYLLRERVRTARIRSYKTQRVAA
jgi:hypothetical protein